MAAESYVACEVADLRKVYALPSERVATKVLPRLGTHMREFIALSPFAVIATVGEDGKIDASPRGDTPGFVRVIDDATLMLPDWPGNNRIDSSQNLIADSHIGTIFFVPGVNETLRINGRARITFDPDVVATLAGLGKLPRAAWVIAIEEAFFHCGRALIRSDLWNPEKRIDRKSFPSYAQINVDRVGGDLNEMERYFERSYRDKLY